MKKNYKCKAWFFPALKKTFLVMRIMLIILLVCVTQVFALDSHAQNAKISLSANEMKLEDIILQIENQSKYRFAYNKNEIDVNKKYSIEIKDVEIESLLNYLFSEEDISYTFVDRQIVLSPSKDSVIVVQQKSISGKVIDSSGQPLPGVTVVVKGTTQGTVTNIDGEYSLLNIPEDATLLFSFVGMKIQEVVLDGQTVINITMTEETIGLEEVVAIGYGSMRKKDITGSIASISSDEIRANPYMNAVQSLQGKVSGVDIYSTSQRPGIAPTIRVRGNRSINANNNPLYVVDGIAFEGDLRDINSSDIESIDILKDASATAIYGSRGANGVVLITTRRGKEGKTIISYDGYYGIQIDNKLDLMNGAEFAEVRRQAQRNAGNYDSDIPLLELDKNMFYRLDEYMIESISAGYDENGNYDPSKVKSYDWIDEVTKLGTIQDHQISITGGNSNTKTLFSAGYFENEGVVKGYGYSKYSLRLTIDQKVNNRINFGGSLAMSFNKRDESNGVYNKAAQAMPLSPVRDENGNFILHPGNETTFFNAAVVAENDHFELLGNRFYSSLWAEINLAKGLKYRLNFGPDYKDGRNGYFYSSDGTGDGNANASQTTFRQFHFTLDNLVYYDKIFNDIHKVGLTVLQSIEEFKNESLNGSVSGLPYEYQEWYNLGTATSVTGLGSGYEQWKLCSFMARANYSFKEKYLVTLTGRYDGSSRLATGHKFSFFPSVALSWRIIEEPFMQNTDFFDNLKLRFGYGMTGNTAIEPYETLGELARTTYVSGDEGFLGYAPSSLSNSELGWEKTSQYNLGLDFNILNNRLSGVIDVYRQNTTDLLLSRALPIASGFSSVTENVGATRNTGLEVSLSGIILNSANGFKWSAELMFYTNKEEIIELYNGKVDDVGNNWFIGQPINVYYDYKFDGIWQNTDEDLAKIEIYNNNGSSYAPGEIRIYDKDENGTINSDDRIILGAQVPKWTGSLNSRFEYKGFDFSFYVYTRQGQMIYDTMNGQYEGRYNWLKVNYWTPENQSNEFPRPVAGRQTPLNFSSIGYQDGSFIKLKTITLGYTFPKSVISALHLSKLRLYMTAQNPYMYTKYWGIDPEGSIGMTYPSAKTFMFGISTSF